MEKKVLEDAEAAVGLLLRPHGRPSGEGKQSPKTLFARYAAWRSQSVLHIARTLRATRLAAPRYPMLKEESLEFSARCRHADLSFESSPHANQAGYARAHAEQRATAAGLPAASAKSNASTGSSAAKRKTKSKNENGEAVLSSAPPSCFPAPLVLPGDDLAWDPTYPAQTIRSWLRDKDRNVVTPEQRTIYVVAPPRIEAKTDVSELLKKWTRPLSTHTAKPPAIEQVADYLRAFYYGMEVRVMPRSQLSFTNWEDEDESSGKKPKGAARKARKATGPPKFIGLKTSTECVGVRVRTIEDSLFAGQMNLNDLLDVAIEIVPKDAYALLMLVEHDLYEEEDDDFACGRAYGGSRVAVVSMARYNPALDSAQDVEREHAWPASHCTKYINDICKSSDPSSQTEPKTKKKAGNLESGPSSHQHQQEGQQQQQQQHDQSSSPMHAAVSAYLALDPITDADEAANTALWLGRVCRTASHELGHCLGVDHCVYYACAMQGTASLAEDVRQPPYLCPVDLAKILRATGADVLERYQALLVFCQRYENAHMFAAFAAWLQRRLVNN